jgi:ATP-dependent Clp protease adaptor protein ClpS
MGGPSTREVTRTESRPDTEFQRPSMWKVILHNDDYTTQEFVVWILETVYHKPRGEAYSIMMSVHRSGRGLAGVYTHDVASTKVASTKRLAEEHEFPLLATMEPTDE